MKKLFLAVLVSFAAISCHNVKNEPITVNSIEASDNENFIYRVELDFYPADQILYTNTPYKVGDTLK